jgi:endonuclease/exonuclease/phosphatase family metal-dependent hydrolase
MEDSNMKAALIILLFTGLFIIPAWANLGLSPDISYPAVYATKSGKLEVFFRGENNHLIWKRFNGSKWSGGVNLGGHLTASPAVTSLKPGRLDVFVRGRSGHLVHRWWNGSQWSGWINLGGHLTSSPAATSCREGKIDVFVRGLNGHLVQRTFSNNRWSGWINLGGDLTSAPAVTAPAANHLEVFVRGKNHHLVRRSWRGSWSGWINLGGDLFSAPAVTSTNTKNLHVFARSAAGKLLYRLFDGRRWQGWTDLGGHLSAAPAVAASTQELVVRASHHGASPTGQVHKKVKVSVRGKRAGHVAPLAGQRVKKIHLLVRGKNGHLVHRSLKGGRWSGWRNLGENLSGKLRARLKILTYNIYGTSKSRCSARAKRLGKMIANVKPPYDIVGVQEFYASIDADLFTCDSKHFEQAIWSTGRYRNSNNYYRFYPKARFKPDGGIGIFTLHPIMKFDYWNWRDNVSRFKAQEGFIFSRIQIPRTRIMVDIYVVHVSSGSGNRNKRKNQLIQLAKKIHQLSRNSGNPVIVMGDFNIGGPPTYKGNSGYRGQILKYLRHPEDLWMKTNPASPGYTYDCTHNKTARDQGCNSRKRIDYILTLSDPYFTNSPYKILLNKKSDLRIIKWKAITQPTLVDVSDHYGLEATIEIRDK